MVENLSVSQLLINFNSGDKNALNTVMPLVYAELRRISGRMMAEERQGHTLTPTALVHEAYLKLVGTGLHDYNGRIHFLAIAAKCMRRILIDHARSHKAHKRGGNAISVTFNDDKQTLQMDSAGLLELDAALEELRLNNERQAIVIEQWFFGGMTQGEIAESLGLSLPTIRKDWRMARAWLATQLR